MCKLCIGPSYATVHLHVEQDIGAGQNLYLVLLEFDIADLKVEQAQLWILIEMLSACLHSLLHNHKLLF